MGEKNIDIDQFDARLAAAYGREEDTQQQYDEWAASYDADLVDDLDYVARRQLSLEPEVYRQAQLHGFRIEQIVEAEYTRKQDIDARVLVIRR